MSLRRSSATRGDHAETSHPKSSADDPDHSRDGRCLADGAGDRKDDRLIRLTPNDITALHVPKHCEKRAYLLAQRVEPEPPSPFQQLLFRMGQRHEAEHREELEPIVSLSGGDEAHRLTETLAAVVAGGDKALYQPVLRAETEIAGHPVEIVGTPDFLVPMEDGYAIRDCKLSRRINASAHPEIIAQMSLYSWLFREASGEAPEALEVYTVNCETVPVEDDKGAFGLEALGEVLRYQTAEEEPDSPVGWSKCMECGFRGRCWPKAERERDVAMVPSLDVGAATQLKSEGVATFDDLATLDVKWLESLKRPRGRQMARIGVAAGRLVAGAQALAGGRPIELAGTNLPAAGEFVMFDIEGLPDHFEGDPRIYLWGIRVYGVGGDKGPFMGSCAQGGREGDERGWREFLANAARAMDEHPGVRFVHWHVYEKRHVSLYIKRYGDPEGVGQRVLDSLLDLHRVVKDSWALPLPSYSLKVVEGFVGFEREITDYNGTQSIVDYIEAIESGDDTRREELLARIEQYNEEDLDATWAVMKWAISQGVSSAP